jgi:DNA-binding SARP family transcriptional activator
VEFRLLGPLEVRRDGRPVRIEGVKERVVLAVLLLHAGEAVSTDRLIEDVWGERPPATARKSLQVRVAGLRRALQDELLETRADGYAIELVDHELDLRRFELLLSEGQRLLATGKPADAAETLREALALWRGPPLADFAYEPFAQLPIARLEELRLGARESRIDADLALGRHAEIVGELTELVAGHPTRERLRGQLMLALYRDGRQAEALEIYRATRDLLVDELGIEPSVALQHLHVAILRQEDFVDAPVTSSDRSILVSPPQSGDIDDLLMLAEALAVQPRREVIIARVTPPGQDVTAAAAELNELRAQMQSRGTVTRAIAFTSDAVGNELTRIARQQDVDLLLVGHGPDLGGDALLEMILADALCDVAVHVGRDAPASRGPVTALFGGSEDDWAAVELGAWIARSHDVLLRIAGPARGRERDSSRTLASASLAVQRVLGVASEPVLVEPDQRALLEAVDDAGIVVVGLPTGRQSDLGPVRAALATHARPPVLFVHRGLRPGGLAPRESLTRFTWTLGPTH